MYVCMYLSLYVYVFIRSCRCTFLSVVHIVNTLSICMNISVINMTSLPLDSFSFLPDLWHGVGRGMYICRYAFLYVCMSICMHVGMYASKTSKCIRTNLATLLHSPPSPPALLSNLFYFVFLVNRMDSLLTWMILLIRWRLF